MRAKETLQLRHQLACNGLSLRAATYDAKRHHVLAFDSHPLRPHVLRLFSLRRELKSAPLFDRQRKETRDNTPRHKKFSLFELQQQQQERLAQPPEAEVVVPSVLLAYSPTLDVFVCVYTSANRVKHSKKPLATTHSVLLLEPATLRKLILYSGPATHSLQCAHFDPWTDRLVLASHLNLGKHEEGYLLPKSPMNVVEILQLSKRLDDRNAEWPSSDFQDPEEQPRMLLYVENTRASLRHPDTLDVICGSRGLRALYGAAGGATGKQATRSASGSIDASRIENAFLEWRASQTYVGKFALVRRVILREGITAMAISPCGDWLFAGFCKGGLKVWNVNASRTNGTTLFTVGAAPYEPTGKDIEGAQAEIVSSIEIATAPTPETNSVTVASSVADLIVIAAAEDTGIIRHWKFSIDRSNDGANTEERLHPRLDLVGYFNCGGKDEDNQEGKRRRDKDALGPPLKTLLMCVNIDMGGCSESLLLVVHEDIIHVLKVQTVLYVMQNFASVETIYAVRAVTIQGERRVISLTGTPSSKLRTFLLDDNVTASDQISAAQGLFISPPSSVSAHISFIETVMKDKEQTSFIVLAWSNGVVDIYDVSQDKRVMTLLDNQLTDRITALSVITFRRTSRVNDKPAVQLSDELDYLSYGGGFINDLTGQTDTSIHMDDIVHARKMAVVVGTENGTLLAWNVDGLWEECLKMRSIPAAKVRVKAAHSAHVVQLAFIDTSGVGEQTVLTSVGAGGTIKLWKIPSLALVGYVSSVAEGYAVAPSCIEPVGILKTENSETWRRVCRKFCVSVGYDDGRLSVWRVDLKHVSFQHLDVATKHERRVTKICSVSSDVRVNESTEFLSCSLDMTVIHWQIIGPGTVQEKRYFDIGAAIVDMILIKERAIIALAHEVCKFVFASKPTGKYLVRHEATKTIANAALANSYGNGDQLAHITPFADAEDGPATLTTRLSDDTNCVASLTHRASRSVDEYLTLRVPTAVLHSDAAFKIPVNKLSPPKLSSEEAALSSPSKGKTDTLSQRKTMCKGTDKLRLPFVDDETLDEYVRDYIARHGTSGTMAAGRLIDLLALRPELPAIKRPGFALAKTLKECKLSALDRVYSEEALQVLKVLFETADAKNMTRPSKEHLNKRVRARKMHEKEQAKCKPVVTYNILGEKHVQWQEVRSVQGEVQNQCPPSPINSVVVHAPPSPSLHDNSTTGWSYTDLPQGTTTPEGLPKFNDAASLNIEALPAGKDGFWDGRSGFNNVDSLSGSTECVVTSNGDHPAEAKTAEFNNTESIAALSMGNEEARHSAMKQHLNKQIDEYGFPRASRQSGHENTLLSSIRLSSKFQKFWTNGFCWCQPASQLHIIWTDHEKGKPSNENTNTQQRRCGGCRNRLHTIKLSYVGYTPHYSRQAIFGIILEVYSSLTATAHTLLYKSSGARHHSSEFSIFAALYGVFLATYGMQSTAELKLKLFVVSMCHFLRDYDVIAVFDELIGLHSLEDADECDHAPSSLVALCVCCYSWMYSRGMVTNGDCLAGCDRGGERWRRTNARVAEVTPSRDGTTHWQYVRVEHALLCAQDNLLYPLVSPGFLRNIMLFMQEYAQQTPTRPRSVGGYELGDESVVDHYESSLNNPVVWIELHRFLRFIVGEWKHQNAQFRMAERLLFVHPMRDVVFEGEILEKLRLMLNCFVFYDYERGGAIDIRDFERLLVKLKYLWPEQVTAPLAFNPLTSEDPVFDDALLAIRKRFTDVNHDGQLCYLDFWVMLYIVSVKTRSFINLLEIPSFCRDYRLEVLPELTDTLWSYTQLSCTILPPKGLHLGKSSLDQKAERQHRRRVGGLHDGMFHIGKTLDTSLATQELLSSDTTQGRGLFLDGSVPAIRQSVSMAALDRFRPVSVDAADRNDSSLSRHGREPVVVGTRPIGPTPKRIAPLRVSSLGYHGMSNDFDGFFDPKVSVGTNEINPSNRKQRAEGDYTNIYIQFPKIPPVCKRIGRGVPSEEMLYPTRQIVGNIPKKEDDDSKDDIVLKEGQEDHREELLQVDIPPAVQNISSRAPSAKSVSLIYDKPTPRDQTVQEIVVPVDEPRPMSKKSSIKRIRSSAPIVVVPTVETEAPGSRKSSRSERLKRQPSKGVQRVKSTRAKLKEIASIVNTEEISPPSPVATPVTHEETPPDSGNEEYQDVGPHTGALEIDIEEEKPHEQDKEASQMVADPITTVVDEDPPESEIGVEALIENADFIVESADLTTPCIENQVEEEVAEGETTPEPPELEQNEVVESAPIVAELSKPVAAEMSEPSLVVDDITEPAALTDDDVSVLEEEVSQKPMFFNGSISEEDVLEVESGGEDEDVTEKTDSSQHAPQTIKEEETQMHHAFRFSQQPTFIRSVEVSCNPFRTAMWNPNDDSESDDENDDYERFSDADDQDSRDMNASLQSNQDENSVGNGAKLSTTGSRKPLSDQLDTLDSSLQRHKENVDVQGTPMSISLRLNGCVRLNEDAERALYGERILNVLGDGIAFSREAEAAMQHKWREFFDESESMMFSTLRNELEQRQTEQREAEERQRKLRKKWQEQRDQDLLRLQQSRQNNALLSASTNVTGDVTVDANFRRRRINRESCQEVTEELQFGVSIQRECKAEREARFFHFYCLPDSNGSIITVKLHVTRGDAEVFMSTETKVPCGTDFMWKSSERLSKIQGEPDEGHRIILYPHDLLRVTTVAANATSTERRASIDDTNSRTPFSTALRVGFYLSVVTLEPDTIFTLAIMSSGQRMQPSKAMQTVDFLIDRFNMLSRSFEHHSSAPFINPPRNIRRGAAKLSTTAENDFETPQWASFEGSANDNVDEMYEGNEDAESEEDQATDKASSVRKTKKNEGVDLNEFKPFQQLLETLSEKKGYAPPRAQSILLAGPDEDNLDFVQDEGHRLRELHQRFSPTKDAEGVYANQPDMDSVMTEQRLTLQGKRQKLRRVVASRLKQKLEPLRRKAVGGILETSFSTGSLASIRLAQSAPRPIAYSITTLDQLPRRHLAKSATVSHL